LFGDVIKLLRIKSGIEILEDAQWNKELEIIYHQNGRGYIWIENRRIRMNLILQSEVKIIGPKMDFKLYRI